MNKQRGSRLHEQSLYFIPVYNLAMKRKFPHSSRVDLHRIPKLARPL